MPQSESHAEQCNKPFFIKFLLGGYSEVKRISPPKCHRNEVERCFHLVSLAVNPL